MIVELRPFPASGFRTEVWGMKGQGDSAPSSPIPQTEHGSEQRSGSHEPPFLQNAESCVRGCLIIVKFELRAGPLSLHTCLVGTQGLVVCVVSHGEKVCEACAWFEIFSAI